MVKAIVVGAGGKMGQSIIRAILSTPGLGLAGAVERAGHSLMGRDAAGYAGEAAAGVSVDSDLRGVAGQGDVIIDFTAPEVSLKSLELAVEKSMGIVIGTTGFSPSQMERVRRMASETRCVMAPNMSVGVNVLFKIVDEVVRILGNDFDVEILEAHHRFKKDAPSGTALKLGEIVAQALNRDLDMDGVFGRRGLIGERKTSEIGMAVLRAGDIVGDHTVMFGGMGERLEITHRAHSRENFARGAVKAALWVVEQPKGLYDMQDVLGFRRRS